jgi:hypothetical protein
MSKNREDDQTLCRLYEIGRLKDETVFDDEEEDDGSDDNPDMDSESIGSSSSSEVDVSFKLIIDKNVSLFSWILSSMNSVTWWSKRTIWKMGMHLVTRQPMTRTRLIVKRITLTQVKPFPILKTIWRMIQMRTFTEWD